MVGRSLVIRIPRLCGVILVLAFGTDWPGPAARSLQTDTNYLDGPPRQVVLDAAAGRVLIATPAGAWFLPTTAKQKEGWAPRRLHLSAKPFPGRVLLAPGGGLVAELETRNGYAQEIRFFDMKKKPRGKITVPSGEPPYADLFLGREGRLVVTVRQLSESAPPSERWEYGFWGLSPADCKAGAPCKTIVNLPDRRLGSTDPTGQFIALIGERGVDVYDRLGQQKGKTIAGQFRDVELSPAAAQVYLFDAAGGKGLVVRDLRNAGLYPVENVGVMVVETAAKNPETQAKKQAKKQAEKQAQKQVEKQAEKPVETPVEKKTVKHLSFDDPVLGIRPVPGKATAYSWTAAGKLYDVDLDQEEVRQIQLFENDVAETITIVSVLPESDGSAWVTFKRRRNPGDAQRVAGLARVSGGKVIACLALQFRRDSAFVPAIEASQDDLVIWTFEEIRLMSKSDMPTLSQEKPCAH